MAKTTALAVVPQPGELEVAEVSHDAEEDLI